MAAGECRLVKDRVYQRFVGLGRMSGNGGESLVGSADERSSFIEDDGNRNVREHGAEVPFVLERVEEGAVLHFGKDFNGDASGNIHAAEGENFERKIAGFGAVEVRP